MAEEEIPKGIPVREFCKEAGINYAEFAVAKEYLLKFGAIHTFKDILYVSPEDEEYVKGYFQKDEPEEPEETAPQTAPVPNLMAMMGPQVPEPAPKGEDLSQEEVDTFLMENAAEKPKTPAAPQEQAEIPEEGDLSQKQVDDLLNRAAAGQSSRQIAALQEAKTPKNGTPIQDEAYTLEERAAAEKPETPAASKTILSMAYDGDSGKKPSEKDNSWEKILTRHIEKEEVTKHHAKYPDVHTQLTAHTRSTKSLNDMLKKEEKPKQKEPKQPDTIQYEQARYEGITYAVALRIISRYLRNKGMIPEEMELGEIIPRETIALANFVVHAPMFNGPQLDHEHIRVNRSQLETALKDYVSRFWKYCKDNDLALQDPSIYLSVYRTREEARYNYINEFNEALIYFMESISPVKNAEIF